MKKPLIQIEKELGDVNSCTIKDYLIKFGMAVNQYRSTSLGEKELVSFIQSIYSGPIIENDRSILRPKELDVYLPELGIAFEYNGEYWHKEGTYVEEGYHSIKTKKCHDKGIKLYHIWERHWENKQEKMKQSIINIIEQKQI